MSQASSFLLKVTDATVCAGAFTLGPVSVGVGAGQTLAVVGRSGAGKTLFLRSLVGLAPLASGTVQVLDTAVTATEQEAITVTELRDHIGMSFQRGALLDDESVLENVRVAHRDADRDVAADALRLVGLEHATDKTPSALSGGMRRRVGLARALVNAKSVLLCDDVTAGLDPSTGAAAFEEIQDVASKKNVALVVTTHDVDVVLPRATTALVFEDGTPVYLGNVDDMRAHARAAPFAPLSIGSAT